MKKFFMVAVMAVMALSASAQQEVGSWSITPKLGLGYGFISGLGDWDQSSIGTLGADVKYQVSENFGVSAGLDFRYQVTNSINDNEFKIYTVELPVLAHYNFSKNFGVFAGPKVNFVAEAKFGDDKIDNNVKEDTQTTVSLPVGVQVSFNKPWVLSAYYDLALASVTKKSTGNKAKFSSINVTIGYRFHL